MKFSIFTLFTIMVGVLSALAPQKSVIVTYTEDTPNSVIEKAMQAIESAGGMITHEYRLIKGFAAKAPAKILESVQAWGSEYNAVIEEDRMVQAAGNRGL